MESICAMGLTHRRTKLTTKLKLKISQTNTIRYNIVGVTRQDGR
jgi:hypothetical protein